MITARNMLIVVASVLATQTPAAAVDQTVIDAQTRRVRVIQKAAPAVVAIFGNGGKGGGSGVVITPDGYALSNFHVTSGAGNFMKCGLNDGVLYDAVIVGIDPTGDVALLKLLGRDDFPTAVMGDSDLVRVGDWAYAMGNPFLLATDFQPTVTYGIVSGVHRYQYPAGSFLEYADCIQVDSSINPGNSGGPLFNDNGELIGINGRGSFEKRGRVNSGAGYAISINQVRHFIDHLRSGRVVDHATLGATVITNPEGGVVIDSIIESSEAYRRGLRLSDEVVSFAGRPIRSVNQFKNILGIYPKGWRLPLEYRRDGQKFEMLARLRGVHTKAELMPKRPKQPQRPAQPKPDKPDPDQPDPDNPKPEKPQQPNPHAKNQPKPPEQYKHMFVKKDGYANYWFNEQEQNRLMPLVKSWGDWAAVPEGTWKITGQTGMGDAFQLGLAEKKIGLMIAEEPYLQVLDGTDFENTPPGSGGLLIAMHQLKLMLKQLNAGFSEFYYLGSEPLDLTGDVVDVLITAVNGVQTRWYFARQPAAFVGFSSQLFEDTDECEVYFATMEEFGGRFFPGRILVRSGGREYMELVVEHVEISTPDNASDTPKE